MKELCNVESYRNDLITYYRYTSDSGEEKLEQRRKQIEKFSDEYLETIIKNTEDFSSVLLKHMKENGQILDEDIFTSIRLHHMSIDIQNGCSGGFPCDTLITPIGLGNEVIISEHLLKKGFPTFTIDITYDSYEERIDDVVATFPLNELHISCSKKEFDNIYETQATNETSKQLIK